MDADRWQRLNEIFHAALALGAGEKSAFLEQACAGDESLRLETEELIRAHAHAEVDLGGIERLEVALDEPAPAGFAGLRLGPYRICEEIGRGGMSTVWLADRADGQFEQHVAIKVIRRGMDSAQVLARFRAERQILASFDHPNIARLIDGGTTDDGLPYFVMEHIRGRPIDEYADERRLPLREQLRLFLQVCDAVSYAHRHLIVHRDIKPQNILVTDAGTPKLLDFGIAKLLQDAGDHSTHTLSGFHLLTPDYASPEQVEGRSTSTQTDVYSLGVVLYELLTGRSPYRPRTWSARDICESVLTSDVERPSLAVGRSAGDPSARPRTVSVSSSRSGSAGRRDRLRGELRGDLDAIILAALRKEPERRYASVEQLAGDIRRYLDGLPVQARPDGVWYRGGKFARRNRVALTAGVLIAAALVGGSIATGWQAREARVQARLAHAAQEQAERRFLQVRKLANALLFDYHDAIKDLPGATPVRERLVRDALDYLNGLAQEAAGDASLQRELALAYHRVAEVQGGPVGTVPSLGDTGGAIESHRRSLSILESLLAADPGDARLREDVAAGELQLAILLSMTEDQAEALARARRAMSLYESPASVSALELEQRIALANAYDVTGAISLESGQAQAALEIHERQVHLLESAPAADQASPVLRRSLSLAYQHLADAQGTFGDLHAALENFQKSLELRKALAREFPYNTEYRALMAAGYFWEADTLTRLGHAQEALQAYLQSLAIAEELAASDPGAPRGTFQMVRVGNQLVTLGEREKALGYYRRAQAITANEVESDPENIWKRAALIEIHAFSCVALAGLAQHEAASAACDEALQLIDATTVEPTNAIIRASLARSYKAMADGFMGLCADQRSSRDQQLHYARAALDMYRESVAIWTDMGGRGMLTSSDDEEAATVVAAMHNSEFTLQNLVAGQ